MTSILGQTLLYGRRVRIEITPYQASSSLRYGNLDGSDTPLRVAFSVQRALDGKADKGKLTITNLAPQTRDAITKDSRVVLTAGYGNRVGVLFSGLVDKVKTAANGPDAVTEIECADGQVNIQYATVSRTYADSVSLARILQDLAKDLSLTLDGQIVEVAPGIIKGIPNETYPRGMTLDGPVAFWLDLLLRPQLIDWSVQNGRLIIIPRSVTTSVEPCVVLSPSTGMLDTPSFSERALVVASLLNPDILPGRLLQIESKNKAVTGFYKVLTCKYDGDTHDQPWRVECECEAAPQVTGILPLATPNNFALGTVPGRA